MGEEGARGLGEGDGPEPHGAFPGRVAGRRSRSPRETCSSTGFSAPRSSGQATAHGKK
jgi:hypothetical protein